MTCKQTSLFSDYELYFSVAIIHKGFLKNISEIGPTNRWAHLQSSHKFEL